jgi:hypothetical protein
LVNKKVKAKRIIVPRIAEIMAFSILRLFIFFGLISFFWNIAVYQTKINLSKFFPIFLSYNSWKIKQAVSEESLIRLEPKWLG